MNKIKYIFIFLLLLHVEHLFAQESKSTFSKLAFTSYVGAGKVLGDAKDNVKNGFLAMTGIEYKVNKNFSFFGDVNFDSYSYNLDKTNYSIHGNLNIIAFTSGCKFIVSNHKVLPFFKFGMGVGNITIPVVNTEMGFSRVYNSSKLCFQLQTSLGASYTVNKTYGVFVDAGFQSYFSKNILNNNLSLLSGRVGIYSSF